MHRLVLNWNSGISVEVFRLVLTEGVVCPGLRDLELRANFDTLPFYRLLVSPKLTSLSLEYSTFFTESLEEELSIIQPVIMGLDTSPLRKLRLQWWGMPTEPNRQMESVASSAVLRCGSALEKLAIYSPLSDVAVQHIMQLPNLDTWYAVSGPPRTPDLQISDIFPRLEHLSLASQESLEWLTLFTAISRHIPSGQNSHSPPGRGAVQRLGRLVISLRVPIDAVLMSPIMQFRGLISLKLTSTCSLMRGCAFRLTDDNIVEIATALPNLEVAILGLVCSANSCQTTVASLVSFYTCCRDLERLEIHFNTINLRNDLESASADPRLDSLPLLRTRDTFYLSLSDAPYTISEDDVVLVLKSFRGIFSSPIHIVGINASWKELNLKLQEI